MIPLARVTHWLSQLVQIPSVNPEAGDSQAPENELGEKRMAEFLAARFRELGGEVAIVDVCPGRPNVYAWWLGESDSWAALDVHTDTVGVSQMTDPPYDGRIEDGRLWGRGAVDTKASLGLILALLEAVQQGRGRLKHNLLVVGTMSEEIGGYGAAAFAEWVRQRDLALSQLMVAEPTLCVPVYAHKGVMGMRFRVHGRAAHSANPHLGQNAIVAAAPVIQALQAEHERLLAIPANTPLGPATLSVTLIDGGHGHNIVPETCDITLNRRLIPFEEPEAVMDHLEEIVHRASPLPISREKGRGMAAFYQSPDSPWIQRLAGWSSRAPEVVPYGTNALAYGELAAETVIFGPGSIDQAHGPVEWVTLAELEKAAGVYASWLLADR